MKIVGITPYFYKKCIYGDNFDDCYSIKNRSISNIIDVANRYNVAIVIIPQFETCAEKYFKILDGVIFSGNQKHLNPSLYGESLHCKISEEQICRKRYKMELSLMNMCVESNKPILGICGGMQLLNVSRGGSLLQYIPDTGSKVNHLDLFNGVLGNCQAMHEIEVIENTMLSKILPKITKTNSNHTQAVKNLGRDLIVSARSTKDNIVEAIEIPKNKFCVGVEWHPELMSNKRDDFALFSSFFRAVVF